MILPSTKGTSNAGRSLEEACDDGYFLTRNHSLNRHLTSGLEECATNTRENLGSNEGCLVRTTTIGHVDEIDHDSLTENHHWRASKNPVLGILGVLHTNGDKQARDLEGDSEGVANDSLAILSGDAK